METIIIFNVAAVALLVLITILFVFCFFTKKKQKQVKNKPKIAELSQDYGEKIERLERIIAFYKNKKMQLEVEQQVAQELNEFALKTGNFGIQQKSARKI